MLTVSAAGRYHVPQGHRPHRQYLDLAVGMEVALLVCSTDEDECVGLGIKLECSPQGRDVIKDEIGGKLPSGRPFRPDVVRTSARVRV
jgi:hypothetical protein